MAKAPIRLLVVEDEVELLDALARLFSSLGFQVQVASDGLKANQICESEEFDLVLSDVRMPGLNGLELLRRLKARNSQKPKVVLMSGFSDVPISKLYASGADGFFEKPFNSESVRQFLIDGLVPPFERWSKAPRRSAIEKISQSFRSLDDAVQTGSLKAGRQGFFHISDKHFPMLGTLVDFDFQFREAGGLQKIAGQGVVRFHSKSSSTNSAGGYGVEILQLDLETGKRWFETVCAWGVVATIPES